MTKAVTVPVVVQTFMSSVHDLDPTCLVLTAGTEPMSGYIECGRTTLTFIPDSRESRVAREVAALQERIARKRADAEKEVTDLQNRVNNLLAIAYEEARDVT